MSGMYCYSSTTQAIATFTAETSLGSVPGDVVERTKLHILDSIACAIVGSDIDAGRVMVGLFAEMGGRPEAQLLGLRQRLPAPQASYINAYLANLLDLDDIYTVLAHPGLSAVFPALALGERLGSSGPEVLVAVLLGYEVSVRVAEAIRPSPGRTKRVWGLSTPQIFGATAAAARILRLDRDHTCMAFGLGGLSAPVPSLHKMGMDPGSRPVSWVKNNICWAAMGGVLAAIQAGNGVVGNRNILDGERGFWIMAGSDRYRPELVLEGLGERYLMPTTAIKPYGCCRWAHSAVEAAEQLAGEDLVPGEIEEIEIATFEPAATNLAMSDPPGFLDMQWSLPFLIAVVLTGRSLRTGTSEDQLWAPDVRALAGRVRITSEPAFTEQFVQHDLMPARVRVRSRQGETRTAEVAVARGGKGRELGRDEVVEKYMRLTTPVLGEERALDAREMILGIEDVRDIRELLG